jgi:hypothetical protein
VGRLFERGSRSGNGKASRAALDRTTEGGCPHMIFPRWQLLLRRGAVSWYFQVPFKTLIRVNEQFSQQFETQFETKNDSIL